MIKILTLPVGQLQTNCYLVSDDNTQETLIIDPGDDADYIERVMADNTLKPVKIMATHGHFDHILAVTELKLAYNIPFFIHKNDEFLVREMRQSAKYFLGIEVDPPPPIDGFLSSKSDIKVGDISLKIIETPGHTPGSVCLYSKKDNILFCGDLLFAQGALGRTDFSYSDKVKFKSSLKRIFALSKSTIIYPGHGGETTIEEELVYKNSL